VTALLETFTLLIISLFALTMAAPEAIPNHFMLQPLLSWRPSLDDLVRDPRRLVILTSLLMIIFVAFKSVMFIFANYLAATLAQRICLEISGQALEDCLSQDYHAHLNRRTETLIHSVIKRDNLGFFALHNFYVLTNCFSCLTLFVTLAIIEPKLTLIVALTFGFTSLLVYGLVRRQLEKNSQKIQDFVVKEGRNLVAIGQGFREIIIYARQKTAIKRFMDSGINHNSAKAFLNFSYTIPSQVLEIVGFVAIGLVVIMMILADLPLAEIIASTSILMLTAWRILPAVSRLLTFTVSLRSLRSQAMAILEVAERRAQAAPPPEPDPHFKFEKNLTLARISYSYPNALERAVKNLTLTIPKGQSVGLVGLSGSGKTTLALLLSALISPQSGSFLVDGQALDPARRAAYFQILGYVPQNPLLVEGSLAENVAFSQWGEDYDRARVEEVCHAAAMDFAFDHPQGLDQPLFPSSLSGGQAQRTAIARALYPRPQIIIFDEATSALDLASENIIKNTLERFQGQLTAIIIAHRLSTVENCDTLVWMEDGAIKMTGPPKEIIPLYQKNIAELSETTINQSKTKTN
jgi:ABC-type multidrug transport system fused ATPase/permease subunit